MAADEEQMPAPAAAASPSDPPDLAPDPPADTAGCVDGEVPRGSAVTGGLADSGAGQGGGQPQRDTEAPVVPYQDDGVARDDETAGGERGVEAQEVEDAGRGGKRGERKGTALFLPDAKRRKTSAAAGEPAAAKARGDGPEDGRDGVTGVGGESSLSPSFSSFSFSFDTKGFGAQPIETTPKFGSFNFAALASGSGAEPPLAPAAAAPTAAAAAAAAGGGDEVRGQDAEGEP